MGLSSCGGSVANEFNTAMAGVGYRLKRANVWRSKERYAQKKTELERGTELWTNNRFCSVKQAMHESNKLYCIL